MTETGVAISAIGALSAISAVLGWVIKYILKNFNETQRELSKNIGKQADVQVKQLVLVEKQINSTADRDKRDKEFQKEVLYGLKNLGDDNAIIRETVEKNHKFLSGDITIKSQHVNVQKIDKEVKG